MPSTRPALPLVEARIADKPTCSHTDGARLDRATKLVQASHAVFRPTVGEHSVQVKRRPVEDPERNIAIPDPERSRREAQRRARITIRRYAVHNRINRLVTVTIGDGAGCHDRDEMIAKVRTFIRVLVSKYPALRYVYSLEMHPGGHGYHVHLGVNVYVPKELIAQAWGHGYVDVRRLKGRAERGKREAYRAAAAYLSKYVVKAEDEGRAFGKHRYERSQGNNPVEIRVEASFGACYEWVIGQLTSKPWVWSSSSLDSWAGPLTIIFRE